MECWCWMDEKIKYFSLSKNLIIQTTSRLRRDYTGQQSGFEGEIKCHTSQLHTTRIFVTTIKELPDKNFGIGGKMIDKIKTEYIQAQK